MKHSRFQPGHVYENPVNNSRKERKAARKAEEQKRIEWLNSMVPKMAEVARQQLIEIGRTVEPSKEALEYFRRVYCHSL